MCNHFWLILEGQKQPIEQFWRLWILIFGKKLHLQMSKVQRNSKFRAAHKLKMAVLVASKWPKLILPELRRVLNFLSFPPSCSLTRTAHTMNIPWIINFFLQMALAGDRISDPLYGSRSLYRWASETKLENVEFLPNLWCNLKNLKVL